MATIADLLDRDFSKRVDDIVKITNHDPDTVFTELTEYIATDRIKADYESLFRAMAAAPKSPNECVGIWISGCFGSGKSSFAKNLAYVLGNREVLGVPARSLFLQQVGSKRVTECAEFLNRAVPYETFLLDTQMDQPGPAEAGRIAEIMYRVMLRDLGYAEDGNVSELELRTLRVEDLVEKAFDLCQVRRPGKAFAFIIDEVGPFAPGSEGIESLCAVVEQFGRRGIERLKVGKIPGPVWIVVTAQETLHQVSSRLGTGRASLRKLQHLFSSQIDLPRAGIAEVAVRRMLRKKESAAPILSALFRDCGAPLIRNLRLERCSRRTQFDEDQFVRFYPYLPHLIDISLDVLAGIERHPNAPKQAAGANRTIVKQCFELLASEPARLAGRPVGALVSLDQIYDVMEVSIPAGKRKDILALGERFDPDEDYPRMATRVAKAICLMEFAETDLPRTTTNIAALLIRRVTEEPPTIAVAGILHRLKEAGHVRETEDGWRLGDSDELRRAAASLERLQKAVGAINPRPPGWRNRLIQLAKKSLGRMLHWYTRPMREFNASASRSLEETACAIDRLSTNSVSQFSWIKAVLDDHSINMAALEAQMARLRNRNVRLMQEIELLREQAPSAPNGDMQAQSRSRFSMDSDAEGERTAYIIGLFGTGRRYINELILQNIGERAEFFRDGIRLHPGPTQMIYSGHATIRHASRAQRLPAIMKGILEAVEAGYADLIFVYRHPLDSLLTNWVWWRTFIQDNRAITGISQVYKNTDDLCADLERNFLEFKAFAEGDPSFFAASPGPPFLSFAQFVEETELHLQCAPLALRLEDFAVDPFQEFCKIAAAMSLDLDLSRFSVIPPVTKPYGFLAVEEKAPRFRSFIEGLDAETKRRIEKMGYPFGS